MPYCTRCGTEVRETDVFCPACGARQKGARPPEGTGDLFSSVSGKGAALACYIPVIGWIPAIVVLASSRFRAEREVRFHAFQGLYLFVVWLIVDWVAAPIFGVIPGFPFPIARLLKLAVILAWVFMLIKVAQNQNYRLPILGELAERSVAEQES